MYTGEHNHSFPICVGAFPNLVGISDFSLDPAFNYIIEEFFILYRVLWVCNYMVTTKIVQHLALNSTPHDVF